jgi:hypothetical protein
MADGTIASGVLRNAQNFKLKPHRGLSQPLIRIVNTLQAEAL